MLFVGAGTIILPDVEMGDKVIVGAGCVVSNSIQANSVADWNPTLAIGSFEIM